MHFVLLHLLLLVAVLRVERLWILRVPFLRVNSVEGIHGKYGEVAVGVGVREGWGFPLQILPTPFGKKIRSVGLKRRSCR